MVCRDDERSRPEDKTDGIGSVNVASGFQPGSGTAYRRCRLDTDIGWWWIRALLC